MENYKHNNDQEKAVAIKNDHIISDQAKEKIDTAAHQDNKSPLVAFKGEIFVGPIPSPELLAKYNKIIPNAADRILKMAEKQQDHRHHLEKVVIESNIKRSNRGLILGFVLTLVFGISGVNLILNGKSTDGFVLTLAPLATLAGVFVYANISKKRELKDRNGNTKKDKQRTS
jgi:uncharacterized membrane protein